MKRLVILMAVLAVGATGCGKKRKDAGVENVDGIVQADTANADPAAATPETLPAVDTGTPGAEAQPAPVDTNAPPTAPDAAANVPTTSAPEVAPVAPAEVPPSATGTGQIANYAVQRGDTLMKIAFNIYGDIMKWHELYEMNKDQLRFASQLKTGMSLKYDKPATDPVVEKNGDPYLIKNGDTLASIADDLYGKRNKWKSIYENNRTLIKDPNRIYAGFYLYYQMTEQERKEAEMIKAKRQGGEQPQQLGSTPKLPDSAKANTGRDTLKGGALNQLATPPNGRMPASK
jgi:nucleoid-associated protein YgaU